MLQYWHMTWFKENSDSILKDKDLTWRSNILSSGSELLNFTVYSSNPIVFILFRVTLESHHYSTNFICWWLALVVFPSIGVFNVFKFVNFERGLIIRDNITNSNLVDAETKIVLSLLSLLSVWYLLCPSCLNLVLRML